MLVPFPEIALFDLLRLAGDAKPRSQSFKTIGKFEFEETKKFCGFMSLWITNLECNRLIESSI